MKDHLTIARIKKKDEFYTLYEDIEAEVSFYKDYLNNKIIYCNCDYYAESNFVKYFKNNFQELKLKQLITTNYKQPQQFELFGTEEKSFQKDAFFYSYDGTNEIIQSLKGSGDFRSPECIEYLQKADIVITNPPFSLFKEFVPLLMRYEKKFLIIGHQNAIVYKSIFSYIRDNKIWFGVNFRNQIARFISPYEKYSKSNTKDSEMISVSGIKWFTNLDHHNHPVPLELVKTFNEKDYPKLDNYDAINVEQTVDIPKDYFGMMAVPISFMDKYNSNQFKITGLTNRSVSEKSKIYTSIDALNWNDLNGSAVLKIDGEYKILFKKLLIQRI